MYSIATASGKELVTVAGSLGDAVRKARERLEDDLEYGTLDVYEISDERPDGHHWQTHVRTVTFAPDANWDTSIVVLKSGEKISAPGSIPHRVSEEDLDAYPLGSYKRAALEQVIERGGWS